MRTLLPPFFLLLTAFLPTIKPTHPQDFARPAKDFAVFFAVENYDRWEPLKYPIDDVHAIGGLLESDYGFEKPVYKDDPTQDVIEATLKSLITKTYAPDAQLLLFFSGHGDFDGLTKEGFFIPRDARLNAPASYFPFIRLKSIIQQIPCNHILLAIDACYSGTFDELLAMKGQPPMGRKGEYELDERDAYIEKELQLKTRYFIASGKKERTPDQSEFAFRFKRALQNKGGHDHILAFAELTEELKKANPRPYFATFEGNMDESNFLFIGPKPGPVVHDDADDWATAKQKNTVTAYETYKKNHPDGDFVEAADARIVLLRTDNMVLIPGGTFRMGSEDGEADEKPVHEVTVDKFYLSKYEVTVREFKTFIEETGTRTDAEKEGYSYIWVSDKWAKMNGINWRHDCEGNRRSESEYNHPVIHVSWNDAVAYCKWRSDKTGKIYRLPSEAEWEFAAGNGARHTKYSWGNGDPNGKYGGNVTDESKSPTGSSWSIKFDGYNDDYWYTAPIGSYNPNDFGLFDMTGNVWEWCNDWYSADYYKNSPKINPSGPNTGDSRVYRGGSWDCAPSFCRSARRYGHPPTYRYSYLGFRLVRQF